MATQIMKNNINPIEYFTILELNEIVKYLNLYIQYQDYGVEFTWNMFNEEKKIFMIILKPIMIYKFTGDLRRNY